MKRTDRLRVTREVRTVLGWPSDTFAIDYHATRDAHTPEFPHTVLVFVPGNPGLTEWYVPMFTELVQRLGPGFAARGIANAGHSTHDSHVDVEQWKDEPDREACVPWTIDGQAYHKAAYMGNVMDELDALKKRLALPDSIESPRFIVVAHSIGVHFAQRMFMLRPIILHRTCLLISLMPFMRMKAPKLQQRLLDFVAGRPEQTIRVHAGAMHILKRLPFQWVDRMMRSTMPDAKGRKVAVELLRQPAFARNFFTLGLEEIREVPEECDVAALRLIGRQCPNIMLFAGNDHWAPEFHMDDLQSYQTAGTIPNNISLTHMPQLRHDFVSVPEQVAPVVDFCIANIQATMKDGGGAGHFRSKL